MPRSVFLGFFWGDCCESGCAGCDAVSPPSWLCGLMAGRTPGPFLRRSHQAPPGRLCCAGGGDEQLKPPGSCRGETLQSVCGWLSSSQDPLGWGRILPSVVRGNGCKAGLLPPSCVHCNDFGVPWGATRLLGAEGTVQPCCHSSPVPLGSVVSPGGDRCCAKATWILCPPRVRSRTQSLNAQDLCWAGEASFPPLLPFLLLRNSGQGCTGRLADGAPPFRDLITPTSPPSPPGWPEEVVAIPKPVSP